VSAQLELSRPAPQVTATNQ